MLCINGKAAFFEAFPVEDWYNFKPEIKHRTLNFEEAEAEWERRDQLMNKYVLMRQKRDDDVVDSVFEEKGKKKGDLKIHGAEDERLSDDDEFSRDRTKQSRGKKNVGGKSKGGEAYEDSDDGDGEDKEIDYMSDDSSDFDEIVKGPEQDPDKEMRGVDEEHKSSSSDESSDQEPEKGKDEKDQSDQSDDYDSDIDAQAAKSALFANISPVSGEKKPSRSNTPTEEVKKRAPTPVMKRLRDEKNGSPNPAKRPRDSPTPSTPGTGISIEAVRSVLSLKPTTTRELLKKFKTKRTGLTQEQTLERVASIMKTLKSEITKTERDGQVHYKINSK